MFPSAPMVPHESKVEAIMSVYNTINTTTKTSSNPFDVFFEEAQPAVSGTHSSVLHQRQPVSQLHQSTPMPSMMHSTCNNAITDPTASLHHSTSDVQIHRQATTHVQIHRQATNHVQIHRQSTNHIQISTQPTTRLRTTNPSLVELVDTERKYIHALRFVLADVKAVLERHVAAGDPLIGEDEIDSIFLNLDHILHVNQQLLNAIEPLLDDHLDEGRIWSALMDVFPLFLDPYTSYIKDYQRSVETLALCRDTYDRFRDFLTSLSSKPHVLDLSSYLIMPVQRLCKYPLFLDTVLGHGKDPAPVLREMSAAVEAQRVVERVVHQVNAAKDGQEKSERLREIEAKLANGLEKVAISLPLSRHHVLVDEWQCVITAGDHTAVPMKGEGSSSFSKRRQVVHCVLLAEALLVCKASGTKRLSLKDAIPLQQLVVSMPSMEEPPHTDPADTKPLHVKSIRKKRPSLPTGAKFKVSIPQTAPQTAAKQLHALELLHVHMAPSGKEHQSKLVRSTSGTNKLLNKMKNTALKKLPSRGSSASSAATVIDRYTLWLHDEERCEELLHCIRGLKESDAATPTSAAPLTHKGRRASAPPKQLSANGLPARKHVAPGTWNNHGEHAKQTSDLAKVHRSGSGVGATKAGLRRKSCVERGGNWPVV